MIKSFCKDLKKRMIKTLVWPVAMYASETWTLRKQDVDRLNAFEMWTWRKMERVSYLDRKTNEEVLSSVGEKRSFTDAILNRKKNWIAHVLRGQGMLKHSIEGRMECKKTRGRPRIGMIDDLKESYYVQMKRRAQEGEAWRSWVPRTCREAEN